MSQNLQNSLFVEIGKVFEPLTSMDAAYRVTSLFRELGYELPGGGSFPDFGGLATRTETVISIMIEYGEASTDEARTEVIIKLVPEIVKVTQDIIALEHGVSNAAAAFPAFIANAPLDELPSRLLDYIIVEYTKRYRSQVHAVMSILGIFEVVELPADGTLFQPATSLRKIFWDRLPMLLSDPVGLFDDVYNWTTDFNSDKFFTKTDAVLRAFLLPGGLYEQSPSLQSALGNTTEKLNELRFPILQYSDFPTTYSQFGLNVTSVESQGTKKAGFAIIPYIFGAANFDFDLNETYEITFESSASLDNGLGIIIRPGDVELITSLFNAPFDAGNLNMELKLQQRENTGETVLFGEADATRLAIEGPAITVFVSQGTTKEVGFEIKLDALRLVVSGGEGDGFLSKILGDVGINAESGFAIRYSVEHGIQFVGSGGLELQLVTHIELGPIEIQNIIIALKIMDSDFVVEGGVTLKANLGPLTAVVENIGVTTTISFPEGGGNLGPANLNLGFKPPNGLGLSINAGAVIGGGYLFFDFEKEEYAGVMELTIAGFISAKAIGLITTKMPDGSKGFSMLIIITAEFMPPFQLSYGFTLIGVGGLLGLNRTVLLDPLRDAVRTGAVTSIMFPQNVVANAPRIISDLKTIFPPYEGKFLIGPMAKLGWGTPTLISLSLGLIIEIPGNIAILGILKVALPEERIPLIQIQVLFVGTIDFDKKMLTFDASLYESFILTMTLEGDMAVRLKWGDDPDFILTVGGFHPSYTPPPLALPTLRRLAINILNTPIAKIRVECYQAVTSNTVQFGARADLYFDVSACSITGFISFDALFQLSPFHFIVEVAAGFSLSAAGISVMSVRVRMSLEGPTPWRAKGTGSVSLLFFEISADFDVTWGEEKNTALPDIAILQTFIDEINKKELWSTALSTNKNLLVSLRKFNDITEADLLVMHPAGSLVVQQKLLPLTIKFDKIGNQKTNDVQKIAITAAHSSGVPLTVKDVDENFARAQYQNLSDAEKLSKPSFEKMPGGVRLSLGEATIKNGKLVRKKVKYEITIIDKEPKKRKKGLYFKQIGILFDNFLKGNSVSKSMLSKNYALKLQPFDEKMQMSEEGYTVAFQANNQAYKTGATFKSEMMAQTFMQDQIAKTPSLQKEVHIILTSELQEL